MANCFGEVVDSFKLDEMSRYRGKAKSREDRAREAMNLASEGGKSAKASRYMEGVREWSGEGAVSTLCLLYNATGDTLYYVADHDWAGFLGRTPYPSEIGNGQWAAFQHTHDPDAASGSKGAVVYRGHKNTGQDRDFLVAWSTPWGPWYSNNKAYCGIGAVNYFQKHWDDISKTLDNNAGPMSSLISDGSEIRARTDAGGGSPMLHVLIKIPFGP